jgi:hypothetical protein
LWNILRYGDLSVDVLCAAGAGTEEKKKRFRWETYIGALLALELGDGIIGRGSIAADLLSNKQRSVN